MESKFVSMIFSLKFTGRQFFQKTISKFIGQVYNPNETDELKAFSAALGVFIGIIPIWGFQTIAAIFLAVFFKLNKALVVIFSQVSFPPFLPLIVFLSFRVGAFWVGSHGKENTVTTGSFFSNIGSHLWQYIYGSITLAVVAAAAAAMLTFGYLKLSKLIKQYKQKGNIIPA